jgi:hypothetical protein
MELNAKGSRKKERSTGVLRQSYFQEKEQIIREIGNLDEIKFKLGLSQRKLCRLLLVDPSAWTRWNKTGAPPHIYQTLKWLLELQRVNPDMAVPRDFDSKITFIHTSAQEKILALEIQIRELQKAIKEQSINNELMATLTSALRANTVSGPTVKPKKIRKRKFKAAMKLKPKLKRVARNKIRPKSKSKSKVKPKIKRRKK